MLTLTDNASAIVTTLVSRQGQTEDAGLRIHTADQPGPQGEARLAVVVTAGPEPEDEVFEFAGARLFLEESASIALSDKVLDAGVDEEGAVSFAVLPQAR